MATKKQQDEFIFKVAPWICLFAYQWGYKYPEAIIAQACHETGYGTCSLSPYHNYFGMKCGSKWTGKRVNFKTKEEYSGVVVNTSADFRAYSSLPEGINGYFEFLNWDNYRNLKTATSALNYLQLIKADGYATGSNYAENVYAHVTARNLSQWNGLYQYAVQVLQGKRKAHAWFNPTRNKMVDAMIECVKEYARN